MHRKRVDIVHIELVKEGSVLYGDHENKTRKINIPEEAADFAASFFISFIVLRKKGYWMRWKEFWKIRFSWKIHLEYWAYREEMISRRADIIFERAYEIDTISNIYKHLLRLVDELSDFTLKRLYFTEHVLLTFYKAWLSVDDEGDRELEKSIRSEIKALCGIKEYDDFREVS